MSEFIHLHTHTEYSLLDGANRISDIVKTAVQCKQRALAITDHGNMFGALEHYNACKAAGIKPIIGNEMYVSKGSHRSKHTRLNGYNHLTLLAKNNVGYQNLLYLTSLSFVEGLSNRPRVSIKEIAQHSEGIICLSGCLSGRINELLLEDKEPEALQLIIDYQQIFGKDNFFLEIQRNGLNIQDKATEGMYRMHKHTGIPLVATNDIHYHRHEDCEFQDTLLCINTGARKSETDRFRFESDTMYFKSTEEMAHTFRELPGSLVTTMQIAEMVDLEIQQGAFIFPKSDYENPEVILKGIAKQKLSERKIDSAVYRARLDHELQVICNLGFAEYFLVVTDLVIYAKFNGIPVGPGRGSAAGCLVSFLLGITSLDPIRHGLLFERFLNSERKGLPDIDVDFCQERRKEIISYLKTKYGDDKVASIITFGRFGAKKAIRQVARVLDIPLKDADTIAKKMTGDTIQGSITQDKSLVTDQKKYPELFKIATQLEDYVEYAGTHASGLIISSRPLYEVVPLARLNNTVKRETNIVTQWDLEQCEKVGLVKFDILGLETLTIIKRIERLIEDRHSTVVTIEQMTLDDANVFKILCSGDTEGVFQCYSDAMKKLLGELQPNSFEDISSAIALLRPGPMESGLCDQFVRRKHGKEPVTYTHPDLESVLGGTYGTMIYQEQIMQLAAILAGFSLNEADELRKAVGKKLPEVLEGIKERFIRGCNALGKIPASTAEEIWQQILKYARYGFNKSHSFAYALLTYYTAYLKHYYPAEFFCANLTQEIGNTDKLKAFIYDARLHGFNILKPDLFKSLTDFTILDDKSILIGLGAIKGVGHQLTPFIERRDNILDDLVASVQDSNSISSSTGSSRQLHTIQDSGRSAEAFRLLIHNYKDILSTKLVVNLVKAGALDGFEISREELNKICLSKPAKKPRKKAATKALPSDSEASDSTQTSEPIRTGTGMDTSCSGTEPQASSERLRLRDEREVFDFYLSGHPLDQVYRTTKLLGIQSPHSIQVSEENIKIIGIISDYEVKSVKSGANKGRKYMRFVIEDPKARLVCMLFTKNYEKFNESIIRAYESAESIILLGKVDMDLDHPSMMVTYVGSLAGELVRHDSISLPILSVDEPKMDAIKSLSQVHPGKVGISFINSTHTVRTNLTIALTESTITDIDKIIWTN